jgi:hypothetical protein
MLDLLIGDKKSQATKDGMKERFGQVGYLHNIMQPQAGLNRAQHRAQVRLEWMFNGPALSRFIGWARHKQGMALSTLNQLLYCIRHCIE